MVRAPDSVFFIFIYEWKLLAQLDVYHRVRKNHREKTMTVIADLEEEQIKQHLISGGLVLSLKVWLWTWSSG